MEAEMNVAHYHTLINRSINRVFVGERRASGVLRIRLGTSYWRTPNTQGWGFFSRVSNDSVIAVSTS